MGAKGIARGMNAGNKSKFNVDEIKVTSDMFAVCLDFAADATKFSNAQTSASSVYTRMNGSDQSGEAWIALVQAMEIAIKYHEQLSEASTKLSNALKTIEAVKGITKVSVYEDLGDI